jgi:serine/threonine protein kinase
MFLFSITFLSPRFLAHGQKLNPRSFQSSPERMSIGSSLSLDHFDLVRTIGIGSFSHVDLCLHRPTNQFCVLKIMVKERVIELNQKEHMIAEVQILRSVQHPNIVTLYGAFQDDTNLYLCLEYLAGGEVFSHLRTLGTFDLDITRFYASEILVVVQALHSKGIVYRDLKPENLVFSCDGHIKFIDFGFAKQITERTYTLCDTPEYLAPEVVRGEGASFCSDWWAFGILIYEFLIGESPFADEDENAMYQRICRGEVMYPPDMDPVTRNLVEGLLNVDASARLGCTAIGAEEIKQHRWFQGVDWGKVYAHRYKPPLLPMVEREGDSSNFADYSDATLYRDVMVGRPVDVEFAQFDC